MKFVKYVSSDTTFTCLFCHHDQSVTVRMNKKDGIAQLSCKVCDQRFQDKANGKLYSYLPISVHEH